MENADFPFVRLGLLTLISVGVGVVLLLPAFHFSWHRLRKSSVFIKSLFWLPICALFITFLLLPMWGQVILTAGLIFGIWRDVTGQPAFGQNQRFAYIYGLLISLALMSVLFYRFVLPFTWERLLTGVAFTSVYSDVAAYFMGTYLGRHHLPAQLNARKSWEGVAGQFVGAFVGMWIIHSFITPLPLWLWLPVAVGSATGDLLNSFVKRRLKIADWSQRIPGHGGYADRLSSLSTALAFNLLVDFLLN